MSGIQQYLLAGAVGGVAGMLVRAAWKWFRRRNVVRSARQSVKDESEQQKFIARKVLERISPFPACRVCQSSHLSLGRIQEMREFHEGNLILGGLITPVVPITCEKCGHTTLLNAIKLGVVDPLTGKLNG